MGKFSRIIRVIFETNDVPVAQTFDGDEISFGPSNPKEEDKKLEFDKDTILRELTIPPVRFETKGLDAKIKEINGVIKSLKSKKMEFSVYLEALQQLKNRKRFTAALEKHLNTYPITNKDKIEKLASKYKLVFRHLGNITRDIPYNAVKAIDTFCKPLEKSKISLEGNNFFLIASDDWWQTKRDPILVVKSPFGNYYHVLYAWDKEVNIVEELFDSTKDKDNRFIENMGAWD